MITSSRMGEQASKKQVITINSGTNINITNAWLTSNGWNGTRSVIVQNTGNIVASTTATAALIISATMPAGKTLSFVNATTGGVYGKGGAAMQSNQQSPSPAGGLGLSVTSPVVIDNKGIIAGGGGSGGTIFINSIYSGKGADESPAGTGGSGSNIGATGADTCSNGSAGANTYGATGAGAAGAGGAAYNATSLANAGMGGGGAWGSNGGASGAVLTGTTRTQYAAGAGGAAVSGNGNITWTATGGRFGSVG